MNINKKLGRVKQWAGEKMGAEAKTNVSDEFKELEMEMSLRHEGMDQLHKSTAFYIKSYSKTNDGLGSSKQTGASSLGSTMSKHGEDFEADSEFGNCLIALGRSNERLGRYQDSFVSDATNIWLESTERSLVMMKEYQAARKKLEQRRLAYDASLSKMQRAKREDFRFEEELRSQKAKYEESNEEVFRRMQDIKESEEDSVRDMGAFLDAELAYHDKCRGELQKLRDNWPGPSSESKYERPSSRARANTAHSYNERLNTKPIEEAPEPEPEPVRPSIRSSHRTSRHEPLSRKSSTQRSSTFQGPASLREAPTDFVRQASMPPEIERARTTLRTATTTRIQTSRAENTFGDPSDSECSSPERASFRERSVSPATSYGSVASKTISHSGSVSSRRGPPPAPNRATKPAPPPLPAKKAEFSGKALS